MRTDELDYELPPHLIAQEPCTRREDARLMVLRDSSSEIEHATVRDLPRFLRAGDLVILNNTRVIPARFFATRRDTGGRVEGLFLEEAAPRQWIAMLKCGGRLAPKERITLDAEHQLELLEKREGGEWHAQLHGTLDTLPLLERIGVMPLPPYIERSGPDDPHNAEDRARYQTVFADPPGAVAAPTAGLHLTQELLHALSQRGVVLGHVTLHVGAGTFAPVRTQTLEEHTMHHESFRVPAATLDLLRRGRAENRRVLCVGTTSVRALESLPDPLPVEGFAARTNLLIQPGFRFRFCDGLLTNFHLPRSTLLALVAARIGLGRLHEAYRTATEQKYRFYSYGDAMLILP